MKGNKMTTRTREQAMRYGGIRGTEYRHPKPKDIKPEGEDQPRDKKKKPTKEDYIDTVIKESLKDSHKRSLYDLSELAKLAEEQWEHDTNIIKQEVFSVRQS